MVNAPPRLAEVAQAAGVSPQTVSNVLGGRSGFTVQTRDRVLAAVDQLGYRPNRTAQQLRSQRSGQIGLHMPIKWLSVREPFSIAFLCAVTEAAERADLQLVVFTTPLTESAVRELVRSGVDGFVLCNVNEADPRPRIFTDLGVPFSLMGRLDQDLPQIGVDIDNAEAIGLAVDHLVETGRRDIAYVGYRSSFYAEHDRLVGTQAALDKHGLTLSASRTVLTDIDHAAEKVTARLLNSERPDAVVCSSDTMALRVLATLHRENLVAGRDIAVTGFDGIPLPFDVDPPLTTVRLPLDTAADRIMAILSDRISGKPIPDEEEIIPATLTLGATT